MYLSESRKFIISKTNTVCSMSQTQLFSPEAVEEIILPESDNVTIESDRAGGEGVSVEDDLMQRLSLRKQSLQKKLAERTDSDSIQIAPPDNAG